MTLRLVYSSNSPSNSKRTALASVRCSMLRAPAAISPLALKVMHLQSRRPGAADIVEDLVDRLLREAAG
jgi:hypothetical protein